MHHDCGGMNIVRFAFLLSNGNQKSASMVHVEQAWSPRLQAVAALAVPPHWQPIAAASSPLAQHKERIRCSTKRLWNRDLDCSFGRLEHPKPEYDHSQAAIFFASLYVPTTAAP